MRTAYQTQRTHTVAGISRAVPDGAQSVDRSRIAAHTIRILTTMTSCFRQRSAPLTCHQALVADKLPEVKRATRPESA